MTDHFTIITTLVSGFGLALVFGWFAERFLKTPALVGYIVAGVAVSLIPQLPTVDRAVTEQFADIGVMLLMFGVGLHFSVADLARVKAVAVTGALLQMTLSAAAGCAVARLAWDWSVPMALVFGLTLSCASTVVVTKALELRHMTSDMNGQVAIGWLVVQDLVTVFIMVCLPLIAQVTAGDDALNWRTLGLSLAKTLLGLFIFVAGMLVVGRRVFPKILTSVAMLGSRELFTLCVLALAIGIAYGAGAIFNVSFALGAFFAGMVMRESSFAHQAAKNTRPLQDAFAVLFFVSVGLMLDWHVFIEQPAAILGAVFVVMGMTSTMAAALVVLLRWPLDTALTVGACLSQIGEFSFILCGQGIALGLATKETMSLIVAASIVTIALNPLMFAAVPKIRQFLVARSPRLRRAAMREAPMSTLPRETPQHILRRHAVIAGAPDTVKPIVERLKLRRIPVVRFADPGESVEAAETTQKTGVASIVGDPTDPMMLVKAHLMSASLLVLAYRDPLRNQRILTLARELKPELRVLVRAVTPGDAEGVSASADTVVICDVTATANAMADRIELFFEPKTELDDRDDQDEEEELPRNETRPSGVLEAAKAAGTAGKALAEGVHHAGTSAVRRFRSGAVRMPGSAFLKEKLRRLRERTSANLTPEREPNEAGEKMAGEKPAGTPELRQRPASKTTDQPLNEENGTE